MLRRAACHLAGARSVYAVAAAAARGRAPWASASRCLASASRAPAAGPLPADGDRGQLLRAAAPRVFSALRLTGFSEPQLREAFAAVDRDGSGALCFDEVRALLLQDAVGLDEQRAEGTAGLLMCRFDTDGDGYISFEEFRRGIVELAEQHRVSSILADADGAVLEPALGQQCLSTLRLSGYSEAELRAAFDAMDSNRSGQLSVGEVRAALLRAKAGPDERQTEATAALLVRRLDSGGDGRVAWEEFRAGVVELASQRDGRIWPLAGMMLASGLAVGAMSPAFPLLGQELGLSQAQFGLTVSAFGLSKLLASVPTAVLVDQRGRRLAMVSGLLVQAVGTAGVGVAGFLEPLIAARFCSGLGASSLLAGATTSVADISTPLNRVRMMTTIMTGFSAGKLVGPAVGGALIGAVGLAPTLFLMSGVFVANAACTRLWTTETMPKREDAGAAVPSTVGHLLAQWAMLAREPGLRGVLLVHSASWAAHAGACMTLLPLMLAGEQFGLTPVQIGSAFALQSAVSVLGAAPAASLADRWGPERVVAPALALIAGSMAAFPLAGDLPQACAALAAWAAGGTLLGSSPTALAASLVAPEARTQALAMLRVAGDLGLMVGASSVGVLATFTGAGPAMHGTAGLLAAVAAWFGLRGRVPLRAPS